MRESANSRGAGLMHLVLVVILETFLFCLPFLVNATENKWHWVNDQGPSFLVYLLLGYGSWALMVVVAIVYLCYLLVRMRANKHRRLLEAE